MSYLQQFMTPGIIAGVDREQIEFGEVRKGLRMLALHADFISLDSYYCR
jgi:hypothetical protein